MAATLAEIVKITQQSLQEPPQQTQFTWAQVIKNDPNLNSDRFQYVVKKKCRKTLSPQRPPSATQASASSFRNKSLIIKPENRNMEIIPGQIRDKINKAFENAKIPVVVTTVKKTFKNNIIITTLTGTAAELMLRKDVWTPILETPAVMTENTTWHSIMLHGVETKYADMSYLKYDIEKFNTGVKLCINSK